MSDEDVKKDDLPEEDDVVEFEFNDDPEGKPLAFDGAGAEEDLLKKLQKLKAELKAVKKEKEEYLTGWQKERADFANYKKDEDNRKSLFSESVRERILTRFLSVMDSFNMAFANKEAWDKVDKNWRNGVEYIHAQMDTIFEEYGVKEIGKEGEVFDPNIHQSIDMMPTDKKELDHKVALVIQKGYKLAERVLRPARVNVYEFKE
ncbi:MAG: nucleotide exchange factor GrpE [Patescibacteria group bacterium]